MPRAKVAIANKIYVFGYLTNKKKSMLSFSKSKERVVTGMVLMVLKADA